MSVKNYSPLSFIYNLAYTTNFGTLFFNYKFIRLENSDFSLLNLGYKEFLYDFVPSKLFL